MTADLFMVKAPSDWLEPIRNNLIELSLASGCQPVRRDPNVPVLVYINRCNFRKPFSSTAINTDI